MAWVWGKTMVSNTTRVHLSDGLDGSKIELCAAALYAHEVEKSKIGIRPRDVGLPEIWEDEDDITKNHYRNRVIIVLNAYAVENHG
jgi:hypothetical protein